jgi:hypothetical protein
MAYLGPHTVLILLSWPECQPVPLGDLGLLGLEVGAEFSHQGGNERRARVQVERGEHEVESRFGRRTRACEILEALLSYHEKFHMAPFYDKIAKCKTSCFL